MGYGGGAIEGTKNIIDILKDSKIWWLLIIQYFWCIFTRIHNYREENHIPP
jgi:hypothetical protein